MNGIAEEVEAIRITPSSFRLNAGRPRLPARTRSRRPRARSRRQSECAPSSRGASRERPRCASGASGRSFRFWCSRRTSDRAPAFARLGNACGRDGRCTRCGRHGQPRRRDCAPRRVRQGRRARHHRRRPAIRHAGRHEHDPHRLRVRRGGGQARPCRPARKEGHLENPAPPHPDFLTGL